MCNNKQCLPVFALPENQNFVAMADVSSTLLLQVKRGQ